MEPIGDRESRIKQWKKGANEEVQLEEELSNDKLKSMRRERQMKDIRQKDSLDLLVVKRALMLLLCILMGMFSLLLYVMKERFLCHAEDQAIILVSVGMEINLHYLLDDLIHVTGLDGDDVSVIELVAMLPVEAMFCH